MRRSRAARVTGIAAATVGAGLALSSCATPEYTYVGSSDHSMVLRVPHGWSALNTDKALKATSIDPSTFSGWAVFYDADQHPDVKHLTGGSANEPMLFAQTIDVAENQRSEVTDAGLREAILPATADVRKAAEATGAFKVLTDEIVDRSAGQQHGVHMIYEYSVGSAKEYFDRIALTNTKKSQVSLVFVHCSEACYNQQRSDIDDAVTSLTLKQK